jgi:hypothetical protein
MTGTPQMGVFQQPAKGAEFLDKSTLLAYIK